MWLKLLKSYNGQAENSIIQIEDKVGEALIATQYAEKSYDPTAGIAEALLSKASDQMAQAFSKAIGETLDKLAKTTIQTGVVSTTEKKAAETPRLGPWLAAVVNKNHKWLEEHFPDQKAIVSGTAGDSFQLFQKTALHSQTGTQGGYVVPSVFYPQLMKIAAEKSIVRRLATVVPMSSRSVLIPCLDQTTAPTAGETSFFGGMVARWTEEAASLNETEPTFKQIELVAHELSGYSKASMTLLQDNAIALEALLMELFGAAIGWFEDYAFLRGNGVGKPLGITNSPCAIQVTRQTAGQFKLQDAAKMLSRLLPGWMPQTTAWVVSPGVLEYLIQISDSAGNVIWIPNARDGLPMTLFGLPVMVTEKLPSLGTADDVLLVDFKHYLIGDRMQLEIAASEHVAFLNNQIAWRFVHRVDGQPWLPAAVTLSDASYTVSPFIRLN